MSQKNKHIKNGLVDFLNYLKGWLSGKERNSFEKELQKDPFSEEAMEGLESLSPKELEEDILKLNSRLNKRLEKRNRVLYLRIAATIAVIITISTLYFTLSDRQLEEFQGNPEITERVSDKIKEEGKIADSMEREKGHHESIVVEDSPPVETSQENKIELNEPMGESAEVKRIEALSKSGKQQQDPATEKMLAHSDEFGPDTQVSDAAVIAAEVQEEAISVPQTEHAVSVPQQAIPSTRSYAKKDASEVKVSNTITGSVLSAEDNMPISGVTIRVEGTNSKAVTDLEGNFIITGVTKQNPTLVVNFIGMEEKKVEARPQENIQILMESDIRVGDDVILVESSKQVQNEISEVVLETEDQGKEIDNIYRGAYPEKGMDNFKEYIKENMAHPDSNIERAVVVLRFVVTKSGRPSQIEVMKSPSEKFSEEAIRLLKEGPDWVPSEREGQYMEDTTRIRILFKYEP